MVCFLASITSEKRKRFRRASERWPDVATERRREPVQNLDRFFLPYGVLKGKKPKTYVTVDSPAYRGGKKPYREREGSPRYTPGSERFWAIVAVPPKKEKKKKGKSRWFHPPFKCFYRRWPVSRRKKLRSRRMREKGKLDRPPHFRCRSQGEKKREKLPHQRSELSVSVGGET